MKVNSAKENKLLKKLVEEYEALKFKEQEKTYFDGGSSVISR